MKYPAPGKVVWIILVTLIVAALGDSSFAPIAESFLHTHATASHQADEPSHHHIVVNCQCPESTQEEEHCHHIHCCNNQAVALSSLSSNIQIDDDSSYFLVREVVTTSISSKSLTTVKLHRGPPVSLVDLSLLKTVLSPNAPPLAFTA